MTSNPNPARLGPVGSMNERRVIWLSVATAAIRVGNSPRTIKRWIAAGILPATRLPSPKDLGPLRVRLTDLESLMAHGCLS